MTQSNEESFSKGNFQAKDQFMKFSISFFNGSRKAFFILSRGRIWKILMDV
jgi:hypothetical protein